MRSVRGVTGAILGASAGPAQRTYVYMSRKFCLNPHCGGSLFSQLRAEMVHHGGEVFDALLKVLDLLLHAAAPNLLLFEIYDGGGGIRDRITIAGRRPA